MYVGKYTSPMGRMGLAMDISKTVNWRSKVSMSWSKCFFYVDRICVMFPCAVCISWRHLNLFNAWANSKVIFLFQGRLKFNSNLVAKTSTPWKINMEPTNHLFGKENDLNQTSREFVFQPLIFRGVHIWREGVDFCAVGCFFGVFSIWIPKPKKNFLQESF